MRVPVFRSEVRAGCFPRLDFACLALEKVNT